MKKFDFGASFTFMFKDENWITKYLIGILIAIVPILNFAWAGYGIGIIRNVTQGNENPLPTWDDIGTKFKDGLFITIGGLVYNLPILLVVCLASIPMIVAGDNQDMLNLAGILWVLVGCCMTVYLLAYSFLMPAMFIHYARNNTFGSLFQIKEIMRLVNTNISQYLMAWVATLLAGVVFSVISSVLGVCVIPIFIAAAWMMSVMYHAYGQVGLMVQENEAGMIQ